MATEDLQFKVKVTSETTGLKNVEKGLDNVANSAKKTETATKGAAKATQSLGGEMKNAGKLAKDAQTAFAGFASGGVDGLIMGLRGLSGVVKGIAGSFGGLLLPVLAAAAAALFVLQKAASDAAESLQKDFDSINAEAARHKQAMADMEKAASESLKKEQLAVKDLIADFQFLEQATARAKAASSAARAASRGLADAELDAAEASAMAKAKTPEEREAIQRQYADRRTTTGADRAKLDLQNEGLDAERSYSQAQENERAARSRLSGADYAVTAAEGNVASARDELRSLGLSGNFDKRQQAANKIREAEKALELAKGNRSSLAADLSGVSNQVGIAQGNLDTYRRTAGDRAKTIDVQTATALGGTAAEMKASRSSLSNKAAQQQASGDYAGQGQTVAAIRQLDAALKTNSNAVAGAVKDVTKTVDKNTAKANAVRESGGGGG